MVLILGLSLGPLMRLGRGMRRGLEVQGLRAHHQTLSRERHYPGLEDKRRQLREKMIVRISNLLYEQAPVSLM